MLELMELETKQGFLNEFRFLSNSWLCKINFEGIIYPSAEHAYQAAKSNNVADRRRIAALETAYQAYKAGQLLNIRPNWEDVRHPIMQEILEEKFSYYHLSELLDNTYPIHLTNINYQHDNYWGDCRCPKCEWPVAGWNHLGRILMEIRDRHR